MTKLSQHVKNGPTQDLITVTVSSHIAIMHFHGMKIITRNQYHQNKNSSSIIAKLPTIG